MNWDFDDFLKEAEKSEQSTPTISARKSPSLPKFFWMAASLILLISLGVFFKVFNKNQIEEQDVLSKNEILKQKNDFGKNNEIVAIHTDSANIVSDSLLTDSVSVSNEEEVMNKILPKRGRMKKPARQFYVQNSEPKKSAPEKSAKPEYQSNYVIINGQRIENEQEAIDLTKYSFRILSENVSKTVAQTEAIPTFINE